MKKLLLVTALLIYAGSQLIAQELIIEPLTGPSREDTRYIRRLESLVITDPASVSFERRLQTNAEAYEVFRRAKANDSAANVFAVISGGSMGYWAGFMLAGGSRAPSRVKTVTHIVGVIGLVTFPVAWSLSSKSDRQLDEAIRIYNDDIYRQIEEYKQSRGLVSLGVTSSGGLGFEMLF